MSLLSPVALIGLALLPAITLLHLWRSRQQTLVVSSIIFWRQIQPEVFHRRPWSKPRSLIWLLLQLLMVAAFVVALARPAASAPAAHASIYILDASVRMRATDVQPNRFVAAQRALRTSIQRQPADRAITIILAGSHQPQVLVSAADRRSALNALNGLSPQTPEFAPADLSAAVGLASVLAAASAPATATITVARSPEDPLPAISVAHLHLQSILVGQSDDNQGIVLLQARCRIAQRPDCMAFARVHNESSHQVSDRLLVLGNGDVLARQTVSLPARSEIDLSFSLPLGVRSLEMQLERPDILAADDRAWCIVPYSGPIQALLVSDRASAASLRRALAAIPLVHVRVLPPSQFRAIDAGQSELAVFDGWLPSGSLPPAPGLVLIDPPTSSAGTVAGNLVDSNIAGEETDSPLLAGVDLTSLQIESNAARSITLPDWSTPIVWTSAGSLLSAGSNGTQNVALLGFDIARSNLAQLNAFPVLIQNMLHWATTTVPLSATAGDTILLTPPPGTRVMEIKGGGSRQDVTISLGRSVAFMARQPGLYTVTSRGIWTTTTHQFAVNATTSAITPTRISGPIMASAAPNIAGPVRVPWWPAVGVLVLLLVLSEWAYYVVRI